MKLLILPIAIAACSIVGCGGGNNYSANATANCLTGIGASVTGSAADYLAQTASDGAYLVQIDGKNVNVSFSKSDGEARQILKQYQGIGSGGGGAIAYRVGNTVMAWDVSPGSDRANLDGCLARY